MRLPPVPDLQRPGRLALTAIAVGAIVAATLWSLDAHRLGPNLGDTDDATRLVLVRELLAGRGWFDQRVVRLQPPEGVWLHWSRLLDGAIAGWELLWRAALPPARAEWMTRATWPLLWVFAAVAGALWQVRSLAGAARVRGAPLASAAVLAGGVICILDLGLYWAQFQPGRIDHHDVQITLALLAAAGALAGSVRGAALAGAATGLGLAVGLEALVFEAVVAAAFGVRMWADRQAARSVGAYGLALAGATTLAFVAQTPPARWGVPACDALGVNLLAGAVVGGLALWAAARLGARRGWPARLALLAAGGGATLAAYVLLDPHCLRGPFADVDPRMRPFWLDHVQEMRSWPVLWRQDRADAVAGAVFAAMGLLAWALLGFRRERRRGHAWRLSGALLLVAVAAGWGAFRMQAYTLWFSVPPLAVLAGELGGRAPRRLGLVGVLLAAAALSPVAATGGVLAAMRLAPWQKRPAARGGGPPDRCYDAASYALLARLPAGVTLSEIDLGPFVLAHTPSASLSAPYHRMSRGVMTARGVLVAPAEAAAAPARAAGATYLLECRVHARHFDRDHLAPDSLQRRLDADRPPAWLERLSPPGAPLGVFRVRPAEPARGEGR